MNKEPKVSDLTISELQRLIRETVQEAVAEVIVEFNVAAEMEERLNLEAEVNDYLRASLHGIPAASYSAKLDD